MEYTKLGRTDIKVSRICLGTMTWGHQNTEAEGHEQMDYAVEQGVNFFDTAELYAVPTSKETQGKTEEIIGTWFKKSAKRDDIVLATKIAGPGLPWIREGRPIDRAGIFEAVEGSLKRLQTDYIDLYQLHWPNRDHYHFARNWNFSPTARDADENRDDMLMILETLGEVVKQGKIREIGLSDDTAWGTMHYLKLAEEHDLPRIASIQNEYSLLCRLFEPDLSEIAMKEDVGLLAWSPLATGMLSGKYLDDDNWTEGTRWTLSNRNNNHRDNPHAHEATRRYIEVAKKHGLDPCQMAIAYTLAKPFVTSSIIGATSMAQLRSNIAAGDVKLSKEVLSDIEAVRRDFPMPF
jgi:aryl-alcohol dehydrogenase-like predicted oxidoreductase